MLCSMTSHHNPLGNLDPALFLRDYWQKRPLLIRQAYPGFESPFSADELAGLACESEVEARLLLEHGVKPWELRHGPFTEDDFAGLPEDHWTLLVQEVNKYMPQAALLLDDFGFIPGWRVDDLMVSYAEDQGSVGPHVDQYDVFLLQAWGDRRWRISTDAVAADNLLADCDLRIMREFSAEQEWLLQPGDMLYLPPGVAHHGIAEGPCMTFSVGFRAPALAGLLEDYTDQLMDALDPELLYRDPELRLPVDSGVIDPGTLAYLRRWLRGVLTANDAAMDAWFARRMSTPQRGEPSPPREPAIGQAGMTARLDAGAPLWRSDYSRFVFLDDEAGAGGGVTLYVDGRAYPLPPELRPMIAWLTSHRALTESDEHGYLQHPGLLSLLTELYNRQALFFSDDDGE